MSVCNLLSSFELNIFLLVLSLNTICTSFLNLWCVFSTALFLSRHIQKSLNLILCFAFISSTIFCQIYIHLLFQCQKPFYYSSTEFVSLMCLVSIFWFLSHINTQTLLFYLCPELTDLTSIFLISFAKSFSRKFFVVW